MFIGFQSIVVIYNYKQRIEFFFCFFLDGITKKSQFRNIYVQYITICVRVHARKRERRIQLYMWSKKKIDAIKKLSSSPLV